MKRLKGLWIKWTNASWALFAIYLARRGDTILGQIILKNEGVNPVLSHKIRARLAGAVGWQEGIQTIQPMPKGGLLDPGFNKWFIGK